MASYTEEGVQIEKLENSESFQVWNFQIKIIFKSQGIWEIVNGEEKLENQTSDKEKEQWKKKDAKGQKLIVTTVGKKVLMHILNCDKAAQMYKKLCEIYQKDTEKQKCSLLQDFFNASFEKGSDMSLHISKLENLACRLKSINQNIDDEMLISKILSTLPEGYNHFRTAWDSAPSTERTLENLASRLIAEEAVHKNSKNCESVAFKAAEKVCYKCHKPGHFSKICRVGQNVVGREIRCFSCGKQGHMAKNCKKEREKTEIRCTICKKNNHLEKDCYFRKNQGQGDRKVAFLTEEGKDDLKTDMFVIDSGSTSHMANNIDLFSCLETKCSEICVAKKSAVMTSEGKGTIEGETCVLKDVLYVPELSKNLLSVSAITNNEGQVKFENNKVYIMKDNKKVLEGQKDENGLYLVNILNPKESEEKSMYTLSKEQRVKEWHRKLGHLSKSSMKKLIKISTGINISEKECECLEAVCEVCLKAKQTRIPFSETRQRATRPLEIIHTDVCGPIEPYTWDEKRYMVTFLDDYTHFCKVYLLKTKNEVFENLKEYIMEAEAFMNLRVSKLRCDNGGEYINRELKLWCKNRGIIIDGTIPYTPQLNGKAERINRTIMEKARSLIFDSGLNKAFWGEAVYTATYLMNRSPTDGSEITPAEKWFKKKPDLSRLQIFGSSAYAKVLGYLKKLDERSKKYIFIGYSTNGYRLWDSDKKKVVVYRDVVFQSPNETEIGEAEENQVITQVHVPEEVSSDDERSEDQTENQENEQNRQRRTITRPARYNDYVMLTYQEAINGTDKEDWLKAIEDEKQSLIDNNTWIYLDKNDAIGHKILSSKWVFCIKDNQLHKARLVVRGFEQQQGIDFFDTFSPVVNISCLRILFALAANHNFHIKKFDIKTAFLYGELKEKVFMEVPEGFKKQENKDKVCLLKKSLYGLKQASLSWNKHFTNFLKSKGFVALKTEQCIFKNQSGTLFLAIYVDDGIMLGNNEEEMKYLLGELNQEFKMTTANNPTSFLGIEIKRNDDMLILNQTKNIEKLLKNFNMEEAKSVTTPMIENLKPGFDEDNVDTEQKYPYREPVGSFFVFIKQNTSRYCICSEFVQQES